MSPLSRRGNRGSERQAASRLAAREACQRGAHCEDPASSVQCRRARREGRRAGCQRKQGGRGESAGIFRLFQSVSLCESESRDSATAGGSAGATLNNKSDTEEFILRFQFSLNPSAVPMRESRAGAGGSLTPLYPDALPYGQGRPGLGRRTGLHGAGCQRTIPSRCVCVHRDPP